VVLAGALASDLRRNKTRGKGRTIAALELRQNRVPTAIVNATVLSTFFWSTSAPFTPPSSVPMSHARPCSHRVTSVNNAAASDSVGCSLGCMCGLFLSRGQSQDKSRETNRDLPVCLMIALNFANVMALEVRVVGGCRVGRSFHSRSKHSCCLNRKRPWLSAELSQPLVYFRFFQTLTTSLARSRSLLLKTLDLLFS
jgi:hypothetical protein